MATFINVTAADAELLRRNRDQVQGNRLQKVEGDEQGKTTAEIRQAQAAKPEDLSTRRLKRTRMDEPAASCINLVNADYYVISYGFTTGEDLDTRTYLVDPLTQQQLGPVGWCKDDVIAVNGMPIVTWSGDNEGKGYESVLFDRVAYDEQFPNASLPVLSLNAFWFDQKGDSVSLVVTGYKGGIMVLDEDLYLWTNPTAARTWSNFQTYNSQAVQTNESSCINGDYIVKLQINYKQGIVTWMP